MNTKRTFLKQSVTTLLALGASTLTSKSMASSPQITARTNKTKIRNMPIVVSTWQHGLAANQAAWQVLTQQGKAIDAVETGVRIPEADPDVMTVGYGGYPDREGNVTLDASIPKPPQDASFSWN